MRLPVDDDVAISCLVPTLSDHGPFKSITSNAVAAGHLRSYQRTRMRSYVDRGLSVPENHGSEGIHYPFDPISYHLIGHRYRMIRYAQQSRYFHRRQDELHRNVLGLMREMGMLRPGDIETVFAAADEVGCETVAQIGGWVSRSVDCQRRAAFLPYYNWALNRHFGLRFAYALCRVENGAARFLQRIGAQPLTEPFLSPYYRGQVQLLAFYNDAHPRHEPLIQQAMDRLVQVGTIHLGDQSIRRHRPLESVHIRPGGRLAHAF